MRPREQMGLDPRAFADDRMDRLAVHQLLIAVEARSLSERPVELAKKVGKLDFPQLIQVMAACVANQQGSNLW